MKQEKAGKWHFEVLVDDREGVSSMNGFFAISISAAAFFISVLLAFISGSPLFRLHQRLRTSFPSDVN
jgi:hypothetical protein